MNGIACLFGITTLLLAALATPASSSADVRNLIQLNATLQVATKNYDTVELARLITDDYRLVSASGRIYKREAFLSDAADRSVSYEINQPEDVAVQLYNGDAAIVSAILHVRYRAGGVVHDVRVRYGDVWVKLNGQWHYAYGEASPLKH